MNYGFVIDNRKCIGCHACSTACESENLVPLDVNRTWVKYVGVGAFPDVRRHFQVTCCGNCANPPCVRICPTMAMYQREDGSHGIRKWFESSYRPGETMTAEEHYRWIFENSVPGLPKAAQK